MSSQTPNESGTVRATPAVGPPSAPGSDTAGVLALVLAGGRGTRLGPLTDHRAKPVLPFGPTHRLSDFVLGNAINSGVRDVYVMVRYHARTVVDHLQAAWNEPKCAGVGAEPARR